MYKVMDVFKIKFYLRYYIFLIANFFGLNDSSKKKIGGGYTIIFQAKKITSFLSIKTSSRTKLKIAFVTLGGTTGMYLDVFIAIVLRARGHKVIFYIEDDSMPLYEIHDFENVKGWEGASKRGYFLVRKMLQYSKFKYVKFSEVLLNKTNFDIQVYDDILEASLLRHYRVGSLSKSLKDFKKRKELYSKTINISYQVGLDIAKNGFDRMIMNHGLYSSTGPCRKVVQDAGIDVLTHDRAKRKECFNFTWNKSSDKWDVSGQWPMFKDRELTKEDNLKMEAYIKSRIKHTDDRLVYNFGEYISPNKLKENLGLDTTKPIYTLFTNVLWDTASSQREIAFSNPIEWVIETIEWFKENPDFQLILKIHPAEVVIGTKQPFYDVIKSNDEIPHNVKIIKPEAIVNSWSVLEATDLGIVHTTTAGMELTLVGVPC